MELHAAYRTTFMRRKKWRFIHYGIPRNIEDYFHEEEEVEVHPLWSSTQHRRTTFMRRKKWRFIHYGVPRNIEDYFHEEEEVEVHPLWSSTQHRGLLHYGAPRSIEDYFHEEEEVEVVLAPLSGRRLTAQLGRSPQLLSTGGNSCEDVLGRKVVSSPSIGGSAVHMCVKAGRYHQEYQSSMKSLQLRPRYVYAVGSMLSRLLLLPAGGRDDNT